MSILFHFKQFLTWLGFFPPLYCFLVSSSFVSPLIFCFLPSANFGLSGFFFFFFSLVSWVVKWDCFRSFFFLYVGIDCYKIYSLELLLLNPISFSMLYLHFHLFQNIFWFPFWLCLWLIGYSEVYCLNSTYLKNFQFSFFF